MSLLSFYLIYALLLSFLLRQRGLHGTPAKPTDTKIEKPISILVIGATGGTGRQLVAQALKRNYQVTALVRRPEKLQLTHPKLRVIQGDVLQPDSLLEAVKEQQAVICALGHKRFLGPSRILSRGTQNLIHAMQAQGVSRLICQTSMGIGDSAGRMGLIYTFFTIPVVLAFYFYDKTRQERLIAQSDLQWTIVRPAILSNGPLTHRTRDGKNSGSFIIGRRISRADTAAFILDELEHNHHLCGTTNLCGR